MSRVLPVAVICCVFLVLAGINRGFDISDEGLYVLLADPQQSNVAGIFNYDLFFKLFHRSAGYAFSLVELRLIRLIFYFLGAFALTGFWINVTGKKDQAFSVFWISCLGLFAGYGFLPPSLSYNSLVVVISCSWLYLASSQNKTWHRTFLMGILLALLTYVKISLVPLFFPLTIWAQRGFRPFGLGHILLLILPLFFLEAVFLLNLDDSAIYRLVDGVNLHSQRPGYQIKALIKSVLVGGFWVCMLSGLFFLLGFYQRKQLSIYPMFLILGLVGLGWIGYQTHITAEWNHLLLLVSGAALGYFAGRDGINKDQNHFWAIVLFFFPFLLHFGSNVYWLRIGIHYWVFWILAFLLVAKNHLTAFSYFFACVILLVVFNGIWWHPFGHEKPLWEKKEGWLRSENETIYLDPEHIEWAKKVKQFGKERGTDEILAAYRIPGMVWLAGYQVPFSPGFWDKGQLDAFFEQQPKEMIYCQLENPPLDWKFEHSTDLGTFQSDSLQLVWD